MINDVAPNNKLQCDDCLQFYPENKLKECIAHFGGTDRVITRHGIKEQPAYANRGRGYLSCEYCHEIHHSGSCREPWM